MIHSENGVPGRDVEFFRQLLRRHEKLREPTSSSNGDGKEREGTVGLDHRNLFYFGAPPKGNAKMLLACMLLSVVEPKPK